jgi:hypothetical protein
MKKIILGLIIGLVVGISTPVVALYAEEYSIIQNPFPIFVDEERQEIESLNINGTTWLRLGDVGKVLEVSILFDEANRQIDISTSENVPPNKEEGTTTPNIPEVKQYTPDGLLIIDYDDVQYVRFCDMHSKYEGVDIKIVDRENKTVDLLKNNQVIFKNIGYSVINGLTCFELNYYKNSILPLIQ